VAASLRKPGPFNLGGFEVRFDEGRPNASEWVEVGV